MCTTSNFLNFQLPHGHHSRHGHGGHGGRVGHGGRGEHGGHCVQDRTGQTDI